MRLGLALGIVDTATRGGAADAPDLSAFSPADLFALGEAGAWYDYSDLTTLFQERTGASATTPSGVGDVVGTILDKSGNGNHAVMPSDAARPVLRQTAGGLYYDGVDDGWSVDIAGIPDNCSIFTALDPNDGASNYYLYSNGISGGTSNIAHVVSQLQPASVNAGTPAYRVDGVTLPPPVYRKHLLSALTATGLPHVVSIIGADVSAWEAFGFARVGTRMMPGREYGTIIVDPTDTDAADIAHIEAWLAGQSGAVLP